jgi:hypothetical protein
LLFKSTNGGKKWSCINGDYPENEISRVIREDPTCPGLLFVGAETGIFMSSNSGKNWQKLGGNFPVVPVYDMKIKQDDLVVGTHGRSFWILDDLTPLRKFASKSSGSNKGTSGGIQFFPPRTTFRRTLNWSVNLFLGDGKNYSPDFGLPGTHYQETTPDGEKRFRYLDMGENPPEGVIVNYFLESELKQPLELVILDDDGKEIERFSSNLFDSDPKDKDNKEEEKPSLPTKLGFNRFVWNMRYPGPEIKIDKALEKPGYKQLGRIAPFGGGSSGGPVAPPGNYQVQLKTGKTEITHSFEIIKDPRLKTTAEDFAEQFNLWTKIRDKVSATNFAINKIRRINHQITALLAREIFSNSAAEKKITEVRKTAETLREKLSKIENQLTQNQYETPSDRLRHPTMLKERMEALVSVVSVSDASPPEQAHAVYENLSSKIDDQLALLSKLEKQDLPRVNKQIEQAGIQKLQG